MEILIIGMVCLFIGLVIGHRMARVNIEENCEKLGGFYMGNRIYYCSHIEQLKDEDNGTKPKPPKSGLMREGSDKSYDK